MGKVTKAESDTAPKKPAKVPSAELVSMVRAHTEKDRQQAREQSLKDTQAIIDQIKRENRLANL